MYKEGGSYLNTNTKHMKYTIKFLYNNYKNSAYMQLFTYAYGIYIKIFYNPPPLIFIKESSLIHNACIFKNLEVFV